MDRRALDKQARAVQVELERAGRRDCFQLVTRWAAQPLDLLREMVKHKPTVVHFCGGRVARGANGMCSAGVYFQAADGCAQLVPATALANAFDAAGSVKLVILDACFSEEHAAAVAACIDCVVGMAGETVDGAAMSFAIGLYGGLGEGESVAAAFKQGCAAIGLARVGDPSQPQLRVRKGVDASGLVLTERRDIERTRDKIAQYLPRIIVGSDLENEADRRYFELLLGRTPDAFASRMRIKTPAGAAHANAKYTAIKAVEELRRLVMIGPPGSGKSTALRRLALTFAQRHDEWAKRGVRLAPDDSPIPISIWLPRFASIRGATPFDRILSLIADAFHHAEVELQPDELHQLVEEWPLVLLLDGLNEMGDADRGVFLDGLDAFLDTHGQHRLVLSSRTYNFPFGRNALPVLELDELRYPEDVRTFIDCYLTGPPAAKLLDQLRRKRQMRQLASNPLLLMLMTAQVKYDARGIPESRGRLLQEIVGGLLGEWSTPLWQTPGAGWMWLEDRRDLLAALGYAMRSEGLELPRSKVIEIFKDLVAHGGLSPGNPARPSRFPAPTADSDWDALLDELEQARLVVMHPGARSVRFWHQVFQEYFAALHIKRQIAPFFQPGAPAPERSRARSDLHRYVSDARWHEILAITAGLLRPLDGEVGPDPTGVFIDQLWSQNRVLAAMCFSNTEGFDDQPRLRRYVDELGGIIDRWGMSIPRLLPLSILIAFALGVLFVPTGDADQKLASLVARLGALPGQAVLLPAAFATALVALLLYFRLFVWTLQRLERFTNARFLRPAITALRHLRSDDAEHVLTVFAHRIVREFSVGELTRATIRTALLLPQCDESELIVMLDDPLMRTQALEGLIEVGSPSAGRPIIDLLARPDLDDDEFEATLRALSSVWRRSSTAQPLDRARAIEILKRTANTPGRFERQQAAWRALLELGITDTVEPRIGLASSVLRRHRTSLALILLVAIAAVISLRTVGATGAARVPPATSISLEGSPP